MSYLKTLTSHKKTMALITVSALILSIVLSFLHPLEYRSSSRLLLVQPTDTTSDAYGVIKSVERTSENLSQVMYTTSFFDRVMDAGFDIDESYFKVDEKKRRKQWAKMISAQVVRGSGMLEIQVHHTQQAQALELNRAIAYTLSLSGGLEYLGNRNIQIKEVDPPLVSKWPVRPNFVLNGLLGAIAGFIISIIYIFLGVSQVHWRSVFNATPSAPVAEPDNQAYTPYADVAPVAASHVEAPTEDRQYTDIEFDFHAPEEVVEPVVNNNENTDNYTNIQSGSGSQNSNGITMRSMHDIIS